MQKFYRHVELGSLIALPSDALIASTKTDSDGRVAAARQAKSSGPMSELIFAVKGAENEIAYVEDLAEEQLEKMRKAYRQKDAEALLDRRISLRFIV
jgi:hypothetical protein